MRIFMPLLGLLFAGHSVAGAEFKPLVVETGAAKAYVVPPIMRWSEDQKTIASIDADRARKDKPVYLTGFARELPRYRRSDALRFNDKEADVAVASLLKLVRDGGGTPSKSRHLYMSAAPASVDQAGLAALKGAQLGAFLAWAKEADPLTGRKTTVKEFATDAALGAVSLGVGLITGGLDISHTLGGLRHTVRTGPTPGFKVEESDGLLEGYMVGAMMPYKLDLDGFGRVDYRTFVIGGEESMRVHGEIIIAYRGEKTKEAEDEILPLAWAAATGINLTADQIKEAREAERAYRVQIWEECLASGECN